MKYTTYHQIIKAMKTEEMDAFLRMSVAEAVFWNINLSDLDEEGIEELCERVRTQYACASKQADLDVFCYYIQELIERGEYETPTEECVEEAYERAVEDR